MAQQNFAFAKRTLRFKKRAKYPALGKRSSSARQVLTSPCTAFARTPVINVQKRCIFNCNLLRARFWPVSVGQRAVWVAKKGTFSISTFCARAGFGQLLQGPRPNARYNRGKKTHFQRAKIFEMAVFKFQISKKTDV